MKWAMAPVLFLAIIAADVAVRRETRRIEKSSLRWARSLPSAPPRAEPEPEGDRETSVAPASTSDGDVVPLAQPGIVPTRDPMFDSYFNAAEVSLARGDYLDSEAFSLM